MGIAERRERERESLRTTILEAARDLLSEGGLDALSMRSIAKKIEYSPGTIYLYFRDKDDLIRNLVSEAMNLLLKYMRRALAEAGPEATPAEQHRATGYAYVRWAMENTAHFRVVFEIPGVARMVDCPEPEHEAMPDHESFDFITELLRRAVAVGELEIPEPRHGALVAWGLLHGLISLYLSGHLSHDVENAEAFQRLADAAIDSLYRGWLPRDGAARQSAASFLQKRTSSS
ncbi:MAG: TetR/AcrR family transcriptional regulator [Gemmatimonadota bacterium]